MAEPGTGRKLKLGIVGVGVGAGEILRALSSSPQIALVAGADVSPRIREAFQDRFHLPAYDSIERLCADPEVEAVWISTPNRFHCPHSVIAAEHGKHVIVEKPMAVTLAEAERMTAAAELNGVKLICGHTQSYSPPVREMLKVIRSGRIGKVRAIHIMAYTDWMLSPRSDDELDLAQGGGIPYRQGPHQVDTARLLGGGMVRSVRASVGQWMAARPIPGYHCAFLDFENGVTATVIHNGYGYFNTNELVPWGSPDQKLNAQDRPATRRALLQGSYEEAAEKDALRIGGAKESERAGRRGDARSWLPWDLGMTIVSCEHGDLRHSQSGIAIYDDDGYEEITVGSRSGVRRAELEELYNAVVLDAPVYHSGAWGTATLEVCLAMMQSSHERREVMLSRQVPTPEDYT